MKLQSTLLTCFATVTLFVSGCASSNEHPDWAYRVLLICRDVSQPQQQTAQQRAKNYLAAAASHQKPMLKERYVAVQTLDPTPNQKANYLKFRAAAEQKATTEGKPQDPAWVDPSQLHCLMVFDTEAQQFVGSGCYVVGSLPAVGQIAPFETVNAEYIAP
jgi:hypothetical protein